MKLLLAEDDTILADALTANLKGCGFEVEVAENGAVAEYLLLKHDFDLGVLDLGLPLVDGLTVLKKVRAAKPALPMMVLTAWDGMEQRVAGLNAGADDYLTKPFAPKELSARIRALLRRARPDNAGQSKLVFGELEVIPEEGKVTRSGEEIHLTKTEFRLICELAQNPGKVLSREQLLDQVWGYGYFGDGRLVDVHIRRLRTKVEEDPANPRHVVTVRGLGYRLQG